MVRGGPFRQTIRRRFSLAFGTALLVTVGMCASGLYELSVTRQFVVDGIERLALVPRIGEQLRVLEAAGDRCAETCEGPDRDRLERAGNAVERDLTRLRNIIADGNAPADLDRLMDLALKYEAAVKAGAKRGASDKEASAARARAEVAAVSMHGLGSMVLAAEVQRSSYYRERAEESFRRLVLVFLIVIGVMTVAFALAWNTGRKVVAGVSEMIVAIGDIAASGRLDIRLGRAPGDETGNETRSDLGDLANLGDAFNDMLDAQQTIVDGLLHMAAAVTDAAGRIHEVARELIAGAEEQHAGVMIATNVIDELVDSLSGIASSVSTASRDAEKGTQVALEIGATSAGMAEQAVAAAQVVQESAASIEDLLVAIDDVSRRAEELSSSAKTTHTTMSQVSHAIVEVQAHASDTARFSENAAGEAGAGFSALQRTIEGIGRIQGESSLVAQVVALLVPRVERISQVVAVIEDVSNQTNLLALNASIIAAAAGEAGKSFGVVALQIKQLAQRTRDSTVEIGGMVQDVESGTREVLEASRRSLVTVEEGVSMAREAEGMLKAILESVRASQSRTAEIARATEEQGRGAVRVMAAVSAVAAAAERIANTTRAQTEGAHRIRNNVERLRDTSLHVRDRSQDQMRSARSVVGAVEAISQRLRKIESAHGRQASSNTRILASVHSIERVTDRYRKVAMALEASVADLGHDAQLIRREIARFRRGSTETETAKTPDLRVLLPR